MADWKEALSHYPGYSPDDPRENGATTDADEAAPAPLADRADAGQAPASPAEPAGDPFEVKAQGIYTEPESAWREEPAEVAPRRDLSGDPLALQNQICFPLYAASKELTRRYKPFLDPLGLTYTHPDHYFARLDYARRIGYEANTGKDGEAKGRLWFMVGKSW